MSGVREYMKELYYDITLAQEQIGIPFWAVTRYIHPEDRKPGMDPMYEMFEKEARIVIVTEDNQTLTKTMDGLVESVLDNLDIGTVRRVMEGIHTCKDLDTVIQIAIFGEVKYPQEDIEETPCGIVIPNKERVYPLMPENQGS